MKSLPIFFSQTDSGRTVGVVSLPHGITLRIKAFVEPGRVAYHLALYSGKQNRKRFQKLIDSGPGFWPEIDSYWSVSSLVREKQAIAYLWDKTFGHVRYAEDMMEIFNSENQ